MIRTWMIERAVVGSVLAAVVVATAPLSWTAWLGAIAVLFSFAHGQIADRLAEREAARAVPQVACHAQAGFYFVAKEAAWFGYFVATGAWPALVGVVLFLAYPVWRRAWRRRFPLDRAT